jgi:hypothetical protein
MEPRSPALRQFTHPSIGFPTRLGHDIFLSHVIINRDAVAAACARLSAKKYSLYVDGWWMTISSGQRGSGNLRYQRLSGRSRLSINAEVRAR